MPPGHAWRRCFIRCRRPRPGVHPSAVVAPDAAIDASAEIGPLAVIGARAEIGPRCRVGPAAVIGEGVRLGADCRIGAHVSLSHALLGDRVIVYPGARIGQDGFGFAPTGEGFLSVPQLGRVVLEDDVEIGANTTIDRGALHDTRIGAGSRLDNLVQIGHNVRLGRGCVIVSQVGISGSTILEDHVMVARPGGSDGPSADRPAGADRGAGRRDGGCAGRCRCGRQPGAAGARILPPGRGAAAAGAGGDRPGGRRTRRRGRRQIRTERHGFARD